MHTKYIRHSHCGFVLWSALSMHSHRDMAEALIREHGGRITSAGFVVWGANGRPYCAGVSQSLDREAQPGDTTDLMAQLGIPPERAAAAPVAPPAPAPVPALLRAGGAA